MGLPSHYQNLPLKVKYNFTSYRACLDSKYAIERLKRGEISYSQWKVEWAGICALLKAAVHLMKAKDARSCLPDRVKSEFKAAYDELGKNKDKYSLFWKFIDKERHNILKEYEFSAYEAIIRPDGTTRQPKGLLSTMEEGEKEALLIRSGEYQGRNALEVLSESVEWLESYILNTIEKAGYDPNEERYAGTLLPIRRNEARNAFIESLLKDTDLSVNSQ
jgi:hypothetical protein